MAVNAIFRRSGLSATNQQRAAQTSKTGSFWGTLTLNPGHPPFALIDGPPVQLSVSPLAKWCC